MHTGGVFAQYLDNDEDGKPDNEIAALLAKEKAVIFMTKDNPESEKL